MARISADRAPMMGAGGGMTRSVAAATMCVGAGTTCVGTVRIHVCAVTSCVCVRARAAATGIAASGGAEPGSGGAVTRVATPSGVGSAVCATRTTGLDWNTNAHNQIRREGRSSPRS